MSEPSSPSFARSSWLWGALAGVLVLLCGGAGLASALLAYLTVQPALQAPGDLGALAGQAAALSGGANRIVVVSEDGSLRTLNPDGTDRRLFHLSDLSFSFPAWSPDGAHLAAIGSNGDGTGVYVLEDADDPQATALFLSQEQAPFYLYWAPDSRQIAFLANDTEAGMGLWQVDRVRRAQAKKLATGQPFYWTWLEDSAALFVHSGGARGGAIGGAHLGFLTVSDGRLSANVTTPGTFQTPGVSPSGNYLAYAEAIGPQQSQVVIASRRGDVSQTRPHAGAAAVSWSPGADLLAFISSPAAAPHYFGPLRLLAPGAGEERTLTSRTVIAFFWSPDGRSIAYFSPAGSGNDSGAALPSLLSPASTHPQAERMLLDLWLVNVDSGRQRLLSTFEPTSLFLEQFLPYFDQYALSHRLWSPASNALLIPLVEADGTERVYLVPTDGQPSRALVEGTIGFWSQN